MMNDIYELLGLEKPETEETFNFYVYKLELYECYPKNKVQDIYLSSNKKALDYCSDFAEKTIKDTPYEITVNQIDDISQEISIYEISELCELYTGTIIKIKVK